MCAFLLKEKERLKQEKRDEKRLNKERKLEQRRLELEMAKELKKPKEDMCLADQKVIPSREPFHQQTRFSIFPPRSHSQNWSGFPSLGLFVLVCQLSSWWPLCNCEAFWFSRYSTETCKIKSAVSMAAFSCPVSEAHKGLTSYRFK